MTPVALPELRESITEVVERVTRDGERVVLVRDGRGVAAVISFEDLELLEALEDQADLRAAREALAEMERTGEQPIPWEQVKRELDALQELDAPEKINAHKAET